jgi:uncharacterized alpha-E superfamily protein
MTMMQSQSYGMTGQTTASDRPLLARVAENIYWCSRYVERAEHVARGTLFTSQVATDAGDLDAGLRDQLWHALLDAFDVEEPDGEGNLKDRVVEHLICNPDNEAGACPAISKARENARGVRGEISIEMWQTLNELYWSLEDGGGLNGARQMLRDNTDDLLEHLIRGSMLFQGMVDQTLAHGRRWDFATVGRMLERADATCRLLQSRVKLLADLGPTLETPLRNIQLMAALRMCCSIEAYRRQHTNELSLERVTSFLLLSDEHPRSIRFSIGQAHEAVSRIHDTGDNPGGVDMAERVLGRMVARLEYADAQEVAADPDVLRDVRQTIATANAALHARYFAA